jgi:hypothetical protein
MGCLAANTIQSHMWLCVCVGFCNVWVCVYVWVFVMCGCVYVWVFVMCVSFGNMCDCIYCVFYIVSFMYMISYFFSVLQPSDNSIAVSNSNNNNNNNKITTF